jgi:hypothetical protein
VRANIPKDLAIDHQRGIARVLQPILDKLERHGAGQIVVCMNETGKEEPAPRFVGYLLGKEVDDIRKKKGEPDPGYARFGGRPTSFMYEECLSRKGRMLEVDRTKLDDQTKMKLTEEAQSLTRGITYLMLRAINVDGRWAGLVGIGFQDKDKPKDGVKDEFNMVLTEVATHSELVKYLEENFEAGGPLVTSDRLSPYGESHFAPVGSRANDTDRLVETKIQQAAESFVNALMEIVRALFPRR